jgi:UDP-N-acetyl-D-galactosamine dehydrogenase
MKVGVIGLGYVGLPLTLSFGKIFKTIAYDTNKKRIEELKNGFDKNHEHTKLEFKRSRKVEFTYNYKALNECSVYIVTVPTPIDNKNIPDLSYLVSASELVGKLLKKKDIVVYESTVYPGATEEICVPILEKYSKLKYNKSFFCGYSPERINPGDKEKTFERIPKIVSASNNYSLNIVKNLYGKVIKSKIFVAKNIKTAEAAKIIENTQRDLNISLINECAIIFNKMEINIYDVLKAAETKWNFLKFKPGLVGGHCIGVDPYYLTYKAKKIGIKPNVIMAGRKVNDGMPKYLFDLIKLKFLKKKIELSKSKILILGGTFKEDVADTRNSKTLDLAKIFQKKVKQLDIFDPLIEKNITSIKNYNLIRNPKINYYDCVILAVPHLYFKKMGLKKILKFKKNKSVFVDLKNYFNNSKLTDLTI